MRINFTKMQALGNDFVVIDGFRQRVHLTSEQARRIADRHYGVGCDQILLVEPPVADDADFFYRILNADGGEVQQCGNGARCFARFVHDQGLTGKTDMMVETLAGPMRLSLRGNGREVAVEMGVPCFAPQRVPFDAAAEALTYEIDVGGEMLEMSVLAIGNPHAIQQVADVDAAPVATLGPLIEHHPRFPERVNAGFMQILNRNHLRLRVYERGAGETLACGSGACAAVVAGRRLDLLDKHVTVDLRGGQLRVAWPGPDAQVVMIGPADTVYVGEIELH